MNFKELKEVCEFCIKTEKIFLKGETDERIIEYFTGKMDAFEYVIKVIERYCEDDSTRR